MIDRLPLDLCQALKEEGYPQDGYLAWCKDNFGQWSLYGGTSLSAPGRFEFGTASFGTWCACPDVLTALDWLEREREVFWRRSPDLPHRWKAWVADARGQYTELPNIGADNPIDLISEVLAHLQTVQPQSQEAQP